MVESVPVWCHSFDFGNGIKTWGLKSESLLRREVLALRLPDLRGKTVLDVGAFDGFFSFEAERRGAAEVTALDHYMWSMDLGANAAHLKRCAELGVAPEPYHQMPYWRPAELPGKRGFDVAATLLDSAVRSVAADFMSIDLASLGTFDVVLFLGVLYHLENPFGALRRLAAVTRDLAVIETEAVFIRDFEDRAMFEYFPTNELNGDVSNWWAPNQRALEGMCLAAGFSSVTSIQGGRDLFRRARSQVRDRLRPRVRRYRAIVHALK